MKRILNPAQLGKRFYFTALLLMVCSFIFAQKITVKGKITGENQQPLAGATISVKGGTIATSTNAHGEFTLEVYKGNTLIISFIGYEGKNIVVNNAKTLNVSLNTTEAATLNNVVVIGYGSQNKRNLASATSEVTAKDFKTAVISTLDQALQGRASGVQVVASSGEPGASQVVRIRGSNSLSGDNQPLYVVDGFPVPIYTEALTSGSKPAVKNAYSQDGLFGIDPDDIASIVVLKDAAATAIYGSRGANGVVLITTKEGKKGKGRIGLKNSYSVGSISNPLKMMTGKQYAKIMNETSELSGNPDPFGDIDTISTNTNWYDAVTRQSLREDASLNISGGSEKSSYYISGNYVNDIGNILYSANKKGSFRGNINSQVNNWYTVKAQLSFVRQNTNRAFTTQQRWPTGAGVLDLIRQSPTVPIDYLGYNQFGTPGGVAAWFGNPVIELNTKTDVVLNDYTILNLENDFNILKSLKLVVTIGANQNLSRRQVFLDANTVLGNATNGVGYNYLANTDGYNANAYLVYNKLFNEIHKVDLTVGTEYNTQTLEETGANSSNFSIPFFGINNIGSALTQTVTSYREDRRLQSAFFRGNYTYKGEFVLNTSLRVDGASPFAENKKYGLFPTVGAAWNLDQAKFMKNVRFLSTSKIRASYGETGSQAIAPYSSLQQFVNGLYPTGANNTMALTLYPTTLGNADLSWEKTKQFDIGTDISALDHKLRFSFDYYNKLTSDLLQPRALPSQSGYTTIIDNYGTIRNRGIELSFGADIINTKNTQFSTQFNISRNQSVLVNLGPFTAPTYVSIGNNLIGGVSGILTPGQKIGQFYGYKLTGLAQTSDFVNGVPDYPFPGPVSVQHPGAIKYQDANKDGAITIADRQVLGNSQPAFTFGWTNNFTWKNLSVNLFVTGSEGNKVLDLTRFYLNDGIVNFSGQVLNQTQDWYNHRWTAENPTNDPRYPGTQVTMPFAISDITSSMVEDGSYVRLKSLTFSYVFPKLKVVKDLTLFVTGTNLITITKYAGFDPEVSSFAGSEYSANSTVLQQGIDYAAYPAQRTYTFGVSANF